MDKNKIIGVCIVTVAISVLSLYTYGFFILLDVRTYTLDFALIVLFIYSFIFAICSLVVWIGYTMITTPALSDNTIEEILELREKVEEGNDD